MRTLALTCCLLLAGTAFADAGIPQSDARVAIDKAQAAYRAALLDSDAAKLAKIWTDDYTFTNGRGMFLSKDDRLKNFKTSATELESIKETGYWRRPAASVPTAWMWPCGSGLIHTSCQAGGITSALTRAIPAGSVIGAPDSSR